MANQNFVVHNGLTVGGFVVDATTSNITLPVTKQLAIGNVILRDNGDGKLHIRDITDNSDAELIGTVGAISTTSGNIQIGTNHIESTNPNGPISLRPNGSGAVGAFANIVAIGKGGNPVTITTGVVLDPLYEVNYSGSNIFITTGNALSNSGNVRITMGTVATSTTTGALQVMGGVGVVGTVVAAHLNTTGNVLSTGGVFNALTVNGNHSVTGYVNVTGNVIASTAEVATVETTGMIRANSTVAATSTATGAFVTAGGIGVAKDSVFGGNVVIAGNLFVQGNTTVINANNLIINDSMIYLADDNPADVLDIGIVSSFTDPVYQHTGIVRDATDGIWKLFANVTTEPTTTIDFTNATYSDLKIGNLLATAITVTSIAAGSGAITTTGTVTAGVVNSTGNVLAKNGVLQTLTVNGEIDSQNIVPLASNTYSVGSSTLWYTALWGEAVNAAYADLAEKYIADDVYEPGTVLEFGGEHEVTICDTVMSTRVAGVVSTKPAYLMNHQITGNNVIDLALTGRVPTKVVGPVKKGDLMVAAGGGRARSEENPRVGTVIGKALENFGLGVGLIEVVVGKH